MVVARSQRLVTAVAVVVAIYIVAPVANVRGHRNTILDLGLVYFGYDLKFRRTKTSSGPR